MTTMTFTPAPLARPGRARPRRAPQPALVRACAAPETGHRHPAPPTRRPAPTPVLAPVRSRPARLTARGRVVLAVGFIGVLLVGLGVGQASVPTDEPLTRYGTVTVQPGQTLWGIVSQTVPEADPRLAISEVVAVNGLADADDITAGDQLSVPLGG